MTLGENTSDLYGEWDQDSDCATGNTPSVTHFKQPPGHFDGVNYQYIAL